MIAHLGLVYSMPTFSTPLQIWPQQMFPLLPCGKLVLNRNPGNYFSEVEQSAFSPAHFIPGIEASPDKMLQGILYVIFVQIYVIC